ncbi:MAG: YadA-like family protein [Neisseria meningitidis]|nr:YadA-like family protein [Neisseria meningitidis]
MNKIFKVVWNRTIQSFVVTSELAKGRVKSSAEQNSADVSTKSGKNGIATVFRLTVISAALLGAGNSYAATAARGKIEFDAVTSATAVSGATATGIGALSVGASANATANGAVAVGTSANATHNNSLAVGTNAKATQNHAVAMGADTSASSSNATAIGKSANAVSADSTALGADSKANGTQATAVGKNALADNTSTTALGNSAQAFGIGSMALGQSSTSRGQDGIAIGSGSQAAANAQNAIAIGTNAVGYQSESIAIGNSAQAQTGNTIAIGKSAVANSPASGNAASSAIALGADANATGLGTIAIGRASGVLSQNIMNVNVTHNNIAIGNTARVGDSSSSKITQSIAIGSGNRVDPQGRPEGAWAKGDQSIAVGGNVLANGNSSVAIGGDDLDSVGGTRYSGNATDKFIKYNERGAKTGEYTLSGKSLRDIYKEMTGDTMYSGSYGNTIAGQGSVALGVQSNSSADLSLAIGTKSQATAFGGVALGTGAKATLLNSVALGTASKTDKEGQAYVQREIMGVTYTWAGGQTTDAGDVVSVGSKGYERQIINVSPGDISATSTDAINGSQLYGVLSAIERVRYFSVKSEEGKTDGTKNWNNDGAKATNSIAIGPNAATSTGATGSVSLGHNANVLGEDSVAVGPNATVTSGTVGAVALGSNANSRGTGSIAIGLKTENNYNYSVVVGAHSRANYGNATVVGARAAAQNNGTAMGYLSNAVGDDSVAIGHQAQTTQAYSIAIGKQANSSGLYSTAIGSSAQAAGQNSFAGGNNAKATGSDSVALGSGATTTIGSSVALGNGAVGTANNFDATAKNATFKNDSGTTTNVSYAASSSAKTGAVSVGSAGNERQIHNVAAGRISATSTDAVNGSQLYTVMNNVGHNIQQNGTDKSRINNNGTVNYADGNLTTVAITDGENASKVQINVTQGTLSVDNNGTVSAPTAGVATAGDVANAINNAKTTTKVEAGSNAHVNKTTSGKETTYTVSADKATVQVSNALNLTSNTTTAADGAVTTDYSIDLAQDTKNDIQKGVDAKTTVDTKGLTFNGDSGSTNVEKLGSTVTVAGDDNITTEAQDDKVTVKLNKKLVVDSVKAGDTTVNNDGVKVAGGPSLTKSGIDAAGNKVTNVADGDLNANSKDAVNGSQLFATNQNVATNAANIAKGINFGGTAGSNNYALGDTINVKGDSNIISETVAGGAQLKLADVLNVGQAAPVKIDGDKGEVSGLSNTTLGGSDFAKGKRAATEEQLNAAQDQLVNVLGGNAANNGGNISMTDIGGTGENNIHDAIKAVNATANLPLTFGGDSGKDVERKPGTKLNIVGGQTDAAKLSDGNIGVVANGSDKLEVKLAKDLAVDSVKAGDTTVNTDGVKVGDVNLTKAGLNNGGNKITNVAAGTDDTDAVNVAQLNKAAAAAKTEVVQGDNIVVTQDVGANGQTIYKVATDKNLKVDSVTAGDTVMNNDGVKVGDDVALNKDGLKAGDVNLTKAGLNNGGNKITNIAAGTDDTDAVNVSQLKQAAAASKTEVVQGKNIVVTEKTGDKGQTVYEVATDKDLNVDSMKAGDTAVNTDGVKVGDDVALNKDGLKAGKVNLTKDGLDNAGNKVTNVADGDLNADSKDAVNGSQLYATNQNVANNAATIAKGISFGGTTGSNNYALGSTINVKGDSNIISETVAGGAQLKLADEISVKTVNADTFKAGDTVMNNDGVKVGDKVALNKDGLTAGNTVVNNDGVTIAAPTENNPNNQVKLSPVGLNNGGQRITNVAPGKDGTDAANVNQLIGLGTELQNNINQVGKKAYAGVAGAIAQGSIPQVTRPGATGIGVGSGYYGGQSAMAIGVSAMSDGGNWIVKGNFSANTDGHVGVGAGALYQW